ncbi:peritrophin-48-like [Drosophila busckii]|uniref:peritrophin-48-like n=1 Tax=Drosophila busckii TaxID=30019 RepID=UPI00083E977B|nr:peritrophin-48-like [Drosophila busckii]
MKLLLLLMTTIFAANAQNLYERCAGKQLEMLAHPTEQSKFIICVNEVPEVRECAKETVEGRNDTISCFDAAARKCSADACAPTNPSDSIKSQCASLEHLATIPEQDCVHYWICLGSLSEPIYASCPSGQHYSRSEQQCISAPLAKCMPDKNLCANNANRTFAAEQCYQYYVCLHDQQLVQRTCDYGHAYSQAANACVADRNCIADDLKPDCADASNNNKYFALQQCDRFYFCAKLQLHEGICGKGFVFDAASSTCQPGVC